MKWFRRIFRKLLILFVLVVLVLSVAGLEENWRGLHDWEAYVRDQKARHKIMDLRDMAPSHVPDDQNFAMTPLLAPIYKDGKENDDYAEMLKRRFKLNLENNKKKPGTGDMAIGKPLDVVAWQDYLGADPLEWLKQFDPELREITEASRRPYCRFPLDYSLGVEIQSKHFDPLQALTSLFQLRACAELRAGQNDAAWEDARTMLRIANHIGSQQMIIPMLVKITLWQKAMQVVWEGIAARAWTEPQLAALQDDLAGVDFLADLDKAFHSDRAAFNTTFANMFAKPQNPQPDDTVGQMQKVTPNGLFYRNVLNLNLYYDNYLFKIADVPAHRVNRNISEALEKDMEGLHTQHFLGIRIFNPYKVLAAIAMPVMTALESKNALSQMRSEEAVVACALERHRLANGHYPASLQDLIPQFLKKVPLDVVDGQPLHYRLNADGSYLLYTDGWNGKDDGGTVVLRNDDSKKVDIREGDWVWQFKPANP